MIQGLQVINYSVLVDFLVVNLLFGVVLGGLLPPLPILLIIVIVVNIKLFWRFIMATLEERKIEDFTDLGQPLDFRCGENVYSIPSISPAKAKKLIRMSREISKESIKREKQIKELEAEGKDIPDELYDSMDKLFDFQIYFIYKTGIKKVFEKGEDVTLKEFPVEEIAGDEEKNIPGWSTQLISKVFKRINEVIIGEQEKKS